MSTVISRKYCGLPRFSKCFLSFRVKKCHSSRVVRWSHKLPATYLIRSHDLGTTAKKQKYLTISLNHCYEAQTTKTSPWIYYVMLHSHYIKATLRTRFSMYHLHCIIQNSSVLDLHWSVTYHRPSKTGQAIYFLRNRSTYGAPNGRAWWRYSMDSNWMKKLRDCVNDQSGIQRD